MSLFKAIYRQMTRLSGAGEVQPGTDEFGNLAVSDFLPKYARLVAAGKVFAVDMHAGTAKAPVVAAPTTSPEWMLYNTSATDSLVLLHAACTLKSGTAGLGLALMAASAKGAQTAVTSNYSGTIINCLDGSSRTPDAFLTNNPTLIGGTPAWSVIAATAVNTVATDSVGDGFSVWTDGLFQARPGGGGICLEVVGETGTTALYTISMIFAQINLDRY